MPTLHADLIAIRDARGLTTTDVQARTRMPDSVLREIESGSIFTKPDSQKTYVRSFVRSYAKAIQISDTDAVRALDEFFAGAYDGFLRETYLGESRPEIAEGEPEVQMLKRIVTSTLGAEEFTRPDPSRPHNQMTPPPPDLSQVNWSGIGAGISRIRPGLLVLSVAVLATLGVMAAAWWTNGFGLLTESEEVPERVSAIQPVDEPAPVPDSTMVAHPDPLPETLELLVYAVYDRLEPIRVQTDFSPEVNPYWVEYATAMRFQFQNQISIRGAFPRFILLFNGHVIPDKEAFLVGGNTLTIRRDYLENEPLFRTAPPDSLPGGLPYPKSIVDRPVFRP